MKSSTDEDGEIPDLSELLYTVRDHASIAVDRLRDEVAKAEALIALLDGFSDDAEAAAQTIAASDLEPHMSADPDPRTGLVRASGSPEGTERLADAARAVAEKRWPRTTLSDPLPSDWHDRGMSSGFVLGANWAREQLGGLGIREEG